MFFIFTYEKKKKPLGNSKEIILKNIMVIYLRLRLSLKLIIILFCQGSIKFMSPSLIRKEYSIKWNINFFNYI